MYDGLDVAMTTYLSLEVVEYFCAYDELGVTMTTYLRLGVVEYSLCVWWIGVYHDYIPEFGGSRVFIVCVVDWGLP